jgi:hypothetical protein
MGSRASAVKNARTTSTLSTAPWPTLPDEALYGPLGRFVQDAARYTEADKAGLLGSALIFAGMLVAPSRVALQMGNAWHPPLLYAVLAGRTARARKGTATQPVMQALGIVTPEFPYLIVRGFGSGEALVDALYERQMALVQESEFGAVMKIVNRDGSTLGNIFRQAWDGTPLENHTRKHGDVIARDYMVAMLGHVTVPELLNTISDSDLYGGTINRTLFFCTERSQVLPNFGNVPGRVVGRLAKSLQTVNALKPPTWDGLESLALNGDEADEVEPDEEADDGGGSPIRWKSALWTEAGLKAWSNFYKQAAADDPPGLLGHIVARGEVQAARIALTFALVDGETKIDACHVEAAATVWSYCRASAAHIFGQSTGSRTSDRLLQALIEAGEDGILQSQIRTVLGSSNIDSKRVEAVLRSLGSCVESRPVETGGRTATKWFYTGGQP